ncbi:hypothetical protein ACSBR2_014149 [Camellia fascicularis]
MRHLLQVIVYRYIVTFLMIYHLNKRVVLLPPKLRDLQFRGYIKSACKLNMVKEDGLGF